MFKIFLKPDCPYCAETVSLLKKYKLKYKSHTEPDPEKRSKITDFSKFIQNLFECSKTLNIDSFTKSLRGLVILSFGGFIFFPFNFPDIILIHQ